eukprot:7383107-Prymnesium_polylepis.2
MASSGAHGLDEPNRLTADTRNATVDAPIACNSLSRSAPRRNFASEFHRQHDAPSSLGLSSASKSFQGLRSVCNELKSLSVLNSMK